MCMIDIKVKAGEEFIDSTRHYEEPTYVLSRDGIGLMPLSNLSIVSAKAKQGKTWLQVILAASMLGCQDFDFQRLVSDVRILYIDTDQQYSQTARMKKRIQRLAGLPLNENQDELMVINIRKMSAEERKTELARLVTEYRPTVVFVDNLLHLESNFNDPVSSRAFVDMLLKLVDEYQCLLIGVIHENKSQADSNSKGHVGTMTDESASDKLKVSRDADSGKMTVSHVLSRDRNIDDFSFIISDEGLPIMSATFKDIERRRKEEEERVMRWKVFQDILTDHLPMTNRDLVTEYKLRTKYGDTKAQEDIKKTLRETFICKNDDGLYMINNAPF